MKWGFLFGFSGAGLACLVGAYFTYASSQKMVSNGDLANGQLLDYESYVSEDSEGHSTTMYRPIVQFTDREGRTIDFKGKGGSDKEYTAGSGVEVLYQKSNPQNAVINSFSELWLAPLVLFIFGAVFFPAGIFSYRMMGEIDSSFDTPFFKHGKRDTGRFETIDGVIEEVYHRETASGPAFSFKIMGPSQSGSPQVVIDTRSTHYTINKYKLSIEDAKALKGKTVRVTYDPKNPSEHHFDIRGLLPHKGGRQIA